MGFWTCSFPEIPNLKREFLGYGLRSLLMNGGLTCMEVVRYAYIRKEEASDSDSEVDLTTTPKRI